MRLRLETPIHLFHDCVVVNPLWHQLVQVRYQTEFFTGGLCEWVLANLRQTMFSSRGFSGAPNFVFLLWAIWKARANYVFQGTSFVLQQLIPLAMKARLDFSFSKQFLSSTLTHPIREYEVIQVGWVPPPTTWFKCNTDDSVWDLRTQQGVVVCVGITMEIGSLGSVEILSLVMFFGQSCGHCIPWWVWLGNMFYLESLWRMIP